MKRQLQDRLASLQKEFDSGQEVLRDLQERESKLREALLRISGAIQVLEEELAKSNEAPEPVAGAVRADLGHELREGQGGHRRGGQAGPQDGHGPRLQQIRPDAQELGEEPVELMGDQDLEPRPLLPEPGILAPGAPQRQVGAGLQLGPGDQAGPAELGDLLGIGQIRLLATELPGLADPKGRQRIDEHVPLAPSPEHVRDGLPQVPGRLEGEDAGTPGAAEGGRPGARRLPRPGR